MVTSCFDSMSLVTSVFLRRLSDGDDILIILYLYKRIDFSKKIENSSKFCVISRKKNWKVKLILISRKKNQVAPFKKYKKCSNLAFFKNNIALFQIFKPTMDQNASNIHHTDRNEFSFLTRSVRSTEVAFLFMTSSYLW